MGEIKNRNEVEDKYKWDLTKIYKTDKDYLKDIKKVDKEIDKLTIYQKTMLNSPQDLYKTTKAIFDSARKIDKIYTYAHL